MSPKDRTALLALSAIIRGHGLGIEAELLERAVREADKHEHELRGMRERILRAEEAAHKRRSCPYCSCLACETALRNLNEDEGS